MGRSLSMAFSLRVLHTLSSTSLRQARMALIASALLVTATALEARWTPAADGGPARFSKRYRDAAGIDDSKWIDGDSKGGTWMPTLLPESPAGWILALACAIACYVLYQQQQPTANYARAPSSSGHQPGEASEAARAAFLKRFAQPGEFAPPQSRKAD